MRANPETSRLTRCVLMHPCTAWESQPRVDREWSGLGYTGRPDFERAIAEFDAFATALGSFGADIEWLPAADGLTLDAIYVRDASVVTPQGVVLCSMGKPERVGEPAAQRAFFEDLGVRVFGSIGPDARLEGGDVLWLDDRTVAVGVGYRTDEAGLEQLTGLLGPEIDVITVHLPHWRGPADVFHLMSILSPVDVDLALVYSPLMPVTFRNDLLARGYELIEVPDEEVDMGPNAVAIAPRHVLLEEANQETATRLRSAGVEVTLYAGAEISRKGLGGPTCLTRPLARAEVTSPV